MLTLQGIERIGTIGGELEVSGVAKIQDLQTLQGLIVAEGVRIKDNPELLTLAGLAGLRSMPGSVEVARNPLLTDLVGIGGFSQIAGDLILEGNDLDDLTAMNSVATVGGDLVIRDEGIVQGLEGFDALTFVGGELRIEDNDALQRLSGLGLLASVNGGVSLLDNATLNDVTALSSLETVGGTLLVSTNSALASLDGLDSLTSAGGVEISRNDSLQTLLALQALEQVNGPTSRSWTAPRSTRARCVSGARPGMGGEPHAFVVTPGSVRSTASKAGGSSSTATC